jgi:flagellar protein FlaJ
MSDQFSDYYKKLSIQMFGRFADSTLSNFKSIKPHLKGSGLKYLLKAWVSMIFMTTFLAYIASVVGFVVFIILFGFDFITSIYYVIFGPVLVASLTFMIMYIYPMQKAKSVKKSIEENLPFALIHMNSVVSSGIPPEFMFELLSKFKDYGEVSKQAKLIVRNIKMFGMSSVNAIKHVSDRTPSPIFKEILSGISNTIEKGGNLPSFLKTMTEKALFEYRMKREQYNRTLAMLSDVYTAVLIAAPLMMLTALVMMNMIGGDFFGLTVPDVIAMMTWVVIPGLNIFFIALIHTSYPKV